MFKENAIPDCWTVVCIWLYSASRSRTGLYMFQQPAESLSARGFLAWAGIRGRKSNSIVFFWFSIPINRIKKGGNANFLNLRLLFLWNTVGTEWNCRNWPEEADDVQKEWQFCLKGERGTDEKTLWLDRLDESRRYNYLDIICWTRNPKTVGLIQLRTIWSKENKHKNNQNNW